MKNKVQELCNEIDELIKKKVTYKSQDFITWKNKVKEFLINQFGVQSIEYKSFSDRLFAPIVCDINHDFSIECREDLEVTKIELLYYLNDLELGSKITGKSNENSKKIFIVHGHNETLKEKVSNWLYSLGLEPIILHKKATGGTKSIIDKIEKYSEVRCAIVLLTADDRGKGKNEKTYRDRARQNVIFEAGYFIGKLSAENVILLYEKEVEMPGDLGGCVYILADENEGWKEKLRLEFNEMKLNYNK